mgnify:CR=1 FL=1
MKKAYHIMGGLLCGACLGLAASCGQMEDEAWGNGRCDAMENAEVREGTMFLDVRLSVGDGGPSKRGNLAGGEDGDGREPGNDDENAVTGLTVFLFPNEADLNSETGPAGVGGLLFRRRRLVAGRYGCKRFIRDEKAIGRVRLEFGPM